jgi:hypothetical protein
MGACTQITTTDLHLVLSKPYVVQSTLHCDLKLKPWKLLQCYSAPLYNCDSLHVNTGTETDQLSRWGNIASLLGLLVSVLGFGFTIWQVLKTKRVAEAAKEAAEEARLQILRSEGLVELASALKAMEEIKGLHRQGAWHLLPERYASLRQSLLKIKGTAAPAISEEHQSVFQGAIQHLTDMESKVERALAAQQQPSNVLGMNKVMSLQIDKLVVVLTAMRVGRDG